MSDTIEQHQGRAALKRQGDRIWRWRTYADGVRQTIGACGQAENPAMEIGIDAQVEGGRYPLPAQSVKNRNVFGTPLAWPGSG